MSYEFFHEGGRWSYLDSLDEQFAAEDLLIRKTREESLTMSPPLVEGKDEVITTPHAGTAPALDIPRISSEQPFSSDTISGKWYEQAAASK